ncbi:hypothetical protein HPB52_012152 [Rhipicephalus sanguineus]|uniref:Nodal modulator 1 n=1 Tax=Rhipicephalus sanguineus TaxID=34632 RepID=A0A9D4PZQ7_RHISA|nr:hypothetical protein HPB52_012152 [Rhipicephalus sanguineus]
MAGKRPEVETESDADGRFLVGPLDLRVQVRCSVRVICDIYMCKRKVNVYAFYTVLEKNKFVALAHLAFSPLAGVLVSLSGATDYRNHSRTREDGRLRFPNLSPGNYFLRPMMKEYRFSPASKMLTVGEGATVKLDITGDRVAFSCLGLVSSVTGEAEPGVSLEALGTGTCQGHQEEALSDNEGAFRLRGLLPGCAYQLQLKPGANPHIERAEPPKRELVVTNADLTNVRVIVFRFFNQMDITGQVVTDPKHLPSLKVVVWVLGGFAAGSAQDSCDVDVDGAEELMPVALRDTLRGVRFADYVEVDTGASVCGALTDEDIIAQVAGAQPVGEEPEGEEDEDDEAPVRPSASAVMEALNVARLFFSFEEGEEDSLRRVRALEQRAAAVAFREKKQMIRVVVDDAPEQTLHTVTPGPGGFFLLPPLTRDGRTYCLQLEGSSNNGGTCFHGNTSHRHVTLRHAPELPPHLEHEIVARSSLLALPVTVVALLACYYSSRLLTMGADVAQTLRTLVKQISGTAKNTEGATGSPADTRRKAKARRT